MLHAVCNVYEFVAIIYYLFTYLLTLITHRFLPSIEYLIETQSFVKVYALYDKLV